MEQLNNSTNVKSGEETAVLTSQPHTQENVESKKIEAGKEIASQGTKVSDCPNVGKGGDGGKKRSIAWLHFTKLDCEPGKKPRAACNYCGADYACDTKINGTKSMLTHIQQCKKHPLRNQERGQTTLGFKPKNEIGEGELVAWRFDVEACRKALVEMIILDELPFKFVEGEGFRRFIRVVQPKWLKVPSRMTVAKDILSCYENKKDILKKALKKERICLTTDTWTSIQNLNYMCLTAHYIDSDWKLHKKILNFCLVSNHKGETLGKTLDECLREWGVDKFLTITLDNASSNNVAIQHLKKKTKSKKGIVLEHEHLHVRCSAHVLNLIVCDGLKEIDESILRVRNAVRYVRSSPSRLNKFKECVLKEKIECKGQVQLDVPTRWNSTYFMLERALQFQGAFELLEEDDTNFLIGNKEDDGIELSTGDNVSGKEKGGKKNLGPPDKTDWDKARLYVNFLKLFYDATLSFSGSSFVTSNTFFMEIMMIKSSIKALCNNDNISLKIMAESMKIKFEKYWGEFDKVNMLLFVAVVLDPRYKMDCVKWCFERAYEARMVDEMLRKLNEGMTRLYDWYAANNPNGSVQVPSVKEPLEDLVPHGGQDFRALFSFEFKKHLVEKGNVATKSELEKYLVETCEEDNGKFDILAWWKVNSSRYHVLSQMARDILAIPVTSVASESAFSTGGRIVDPFRSSLSPTMVEALVCTQNWLRSSSTSISLRNAMDGVEEFEKFESKLKEAISSEALVVDE